MAVMFRHLGLFGFQAPSQSYLAVDLFFLLSGAVIANAYDAKLADGLSVGRFMLFRAARLYPMILLGLGLGALNAVFGQVYPALSAPLWATFVAALVMIPGNVYLRSLNGPAWSLTYEFAANAAYAVFARRLTLLALALICTVSAAGLVVAATLRGNLDTGYFGATSVIVGLARVGFSFFGGVALQRLNRAGISASRWLKGGGASVAAVALSIAALAITPPVCARPLCALVSVFVVFPAILWVGLESEATPARLCKAMGLASYPLYLIHAPLILLGRHLLAQRNIDAAPWILPSALGLILAAWLLDRYYDGPARSALMRLAAPRRRPAVAAA